MGHGRPRHNPLGVARNDREQPGLPVVSWELADHSLREGQSQMPDARVWERAHDQSGLSRQNVEGLERTVGAAIAHADFQPWAPSCHQFDQRRL